VLKIAADISARKMQSADFEVQVNAIAKSQAIIEFQMDGTVITPIISSSPHLATLAGDRGPASPHVRRARSSRERTISELLGKPAARSVSDSGVQAAEKGRLLISAES
jgi:hypothetical protein